MHHKSATPTTPALRLTPDELRIHANICGLGSDVERQAAFHVLDAQIRARLPGIPERHYYTFNPVDGAITIDTKRDRPLPVLKISKSTQ